MSIARVVGLLGRLMMVAGAMVLLFVVYQLWGTGLQAAQDQARIEDDFAALQESVGQTPTTDSTAPPTTDGTPPTTAPAAQLTSVPVLAPGDPIGRIKIDKIGVNWMVIEGVPLSLLNKAPGHFPGTPLPGQAGNSAIAGHRTTYGAPFNRIDELVAGDLIEVTTLQGTFYYEVIDQPAAEGQAPIAHTIVRPWETELIEPIGDADLITLVACHPEYSAAKRIVVQGRLTSAPAPTTPGVSVAVPDAENAMLDQDLAGGDPSARPSAIGFGLAAAGIWLAAWLVARRWSWRSPWPWLTYAVALVPFGLLLFSCFENVNRLLPAAY